MDFMKMVMVCCDRLKTINGNDIPDRATAAVENGTGPDIFQLMWNQAILFSGGLMDHTALVGEVIKGGMYPALEGTSKVGGVYRGVPGFGVGNADAYRTDIFSDLGIKAPDIWEEYLTVGKKLKENGSPVGQTLGHTFGDAPTFAYPLLWSFGGMQTDEKQNVVITKGPTGRFHSLLTFTNCITNYSKNKDEAAGCSRSFRSSYFGRIQALSTSSISLSVSLTYA
jgi:ABC-type glycerol-3-phosphate transport system substrate-binding protein